MGFVNYLNELPYYVQEVIPRLERMGLRAGRTSASRSCGRLDSFAADSPPGEPAESMGLTNPY